MVFKRKNKAKLTPLAFLALLVCLALSNTSQAASFDCAKATTRVEKLICDIPVISMLDDDLHHVYLEIMSKSNAEQKQRLMTEQKHWLKHTRNSCTEASCLKQAYLSRTDALEIILKTMPAVLTKESDKSVPSKRVQHVAARESSSAPPSLEEIQNFLSMAHKQLKERQKSAHDVLFPSNTEGQKAYCKHFWNTLKTQGVFDIPNPDMLAISQKEKEQLFEALHNYAKSNLDRYLSQDGNLPPTNYTDVTGQTARLGPFKKGGLNSPKDLPAKFRDAWKRDPDYHGFFYKNDNFDQGLSSHLLYMQPYPIAGYVHPLLITFVKDQCDKCTSVSVGIRTVAVDGLPQPGWMKGEFFSQMRYDEAAVEFIKRDTLLPRGPYLLMGVGVFDGHPIFWALKHEQFVRPSAKEIDEDVGYGSGDGFRDYSLSVTPLDDPRYLGPLSLCSVKFN